MQSSPRCNFHQIRKRPVIMSRLSYVKLFFSDTRNLKWVFAVAQTTKDIEEIFLDIFSPFDALPSNTGFLSRHLNFQNFKTCWYLFCQYYLVTHDRFLVSPGFLETKLKRLSFVCDSPELLKISLNLRCVLHVLAPYSWKKKKKKFKKAYWKKKNSPLVCPVGWKLELPCWVMWCRRHLRATVCPSPLHHRTALPVATSTTMRHAGFFAFEVSTILGMTRWLTW